MRGRRTVFGGVLLCVTAAAVDGAEPLPHLRRVVEGVLVGGEPDGDRGFERLRQLGVRTVVSVDGLPPDADRARAHGIRVIHVPLGYDGFSDEATAALVRIAAEARRPLYVHCHHGKHRGPAAAAVVARAAGQLDRVGAIRLLREAGTDPNYVGLWRDVAAFDARSHTGEFVVLRETAEVDPMVLAMAQLGRAWRRVAPPAERTGQAARATPPRDQAAWTLVREAVRESIRAASDYDPSGDVGRGIAELGRELEAAAATDDGLRRVEKRCADCHAAWRNTPAPVAETEASN